MTSDIAITNVSGPPICETSDIAIVDVSQTSSMLLSFLLKGTKPLNFNGPYLLI